MSTRSYRARNAAYARHHRAAYEAEKLARTPDTSRPRHMLDTAPVATEAPFAIGDMVRWQGEAGELTGTIARFSQYRAEVVTDGGSLFPRINQLVKVA